MTGIPTVTTPGGIPDDTHPVVGWLWELACDPSSPLGRNPWTLDGHTLAGDGRVIVRSRGEMGFAVPPLDAAAYLRSLCEMFTDDLPARAPLDLARLRALWRNDLPATLAPCDECRGVGYLPCYHTSSLDCMECDDRGLRECECPRGYRHARFQAVEIAAHLYDLHVLDPVLPHLGDDPDATYATTTLTIAGELLHVLLLRVGRWEVAWAGLLRNPRTERRVRVFEASAAVGQ